MAEGTKAKGSPDQKRTATANARASPSDESGDDDIYEVEKIIDMCRKEGTILYRVRWEGYGPEWDTWEPYKNLVSCKDMIQTYLMDQKKRKRKHTAAELAAAVEEVSESEVEKQDDKGDSESDRSSRKKGTKGTYFYVNNSDDEADTLKDKFWRDLEQGKIDVFSNDLYSKVKSQGRASRPGSLAEKTRVEGGEEVQGRKKKMRDGRGRKRASEGGGGGREMKRCNSSESTSSSLSGFPAGSASSIGESAAVQSPPVKVKRKRGRRKKNVNADVAMNEDADAGPLMMDEEPIVHIKEETSPASPEVERMDIMSAPASPDEANDGWDPEGKPEVIPDTAVIAAIKSTTETEEQNVNLNQKDPKLKSSCVVVVENLGGTGAKSKRPVHPSTPSNVNTSPLAAKSPLDMCSPALPTTSTVSDPWTSSSPRGTPDVSLPSKLASPVEPPPKAPADDRHFLAAFSKEIKAEMSTLSPVKPNTSECEQKKSDPSPFQVTNYRAIFNKQEIAKTRTDLAEAADQGSVESKDSPVSQVASPVTAQSPRDSFPLQGTSMLPTTATSPIPAISQDLSQTIDSSANSQPSPASVTTTLANALPTFDSTALDNLAASLSMEELAQTAFDPLAISRPDELASGRSSVGSFKSSATPSPSMSTNQAIIPSPSASGDWSNSPKPSPSFESDYFDFDLEDLNFSLLDIKQLNLEHGSGGAELSNADLRHAVRRNDYEKVRMALKCQRNLDLEQPDNYYGMTLLMLAAQFGHDDMLEMLAMHGAQVNAQQKNGATALMHSCEQGQRCTVELLLALGAHVNIPQRNGETALMKAVRRGNKHIVQMLLDAGANFSAHSNVDNSAIKQAKQSNNFEIMDLLNKHINRIMLEFNNQVNITLNNTAQIVSPLFPIQCMALSENNKFTINFNHELQPSKPGLGMLLFIAHARISSTEAKCRFYGPCTVNSVVLNGVPLKSLTEEANFVLSFTPVYQGRNTLDINTMRVPKTKTKLLVCAYKAQLIMPGD